MPSHISTKIMVEINPNFKVRKCHVFCTNYHNFTENTNEHGNLVNHVLNRQKSTFTLSGRDIYYVEC